MTELPSLLSIGAMMNRRRGRTGRMSIVAAASCLLVRSVMTPHNSFAAPPEQKAAFSFRNADYFHRWWKVNQDEFTPAKRET